QQQQQSECTDKNLREGIDSTHATHTQPRIDKAGTNRSHQRARKLQISDVDWYGRRPPLTSSDPSTTTHTKNRNNVSQIQAASY
ncbi:mRNA decay protein, partial [Cryomyces antarcticus]